MQSGAFEPWNIPAGPLRINETTIPIIKRMAEDMPGGFFIYRADSAEEILFANTAVAHLFNCETVDEFRKITNNSFKGFVHPDDLDDAEQSIWQQIQQNQSKLDYLEYRIICQDGAVKWIADWGHYIHSEDCGDLFYVFVSDITERKREEENAQKRALDFERNEALHIEQAKSAFLFNMSHDVRTPLNAIVGFTALARKYAGDKERILACLNRVEVASDHLTNLVDDILDMSKIETDAISINPESCLILEQVSAVFDMFAPQINEKGLHTSLSINTPSCLVKADPLNLRRILEKVIDNAVKYTPAGGDIRVAVSAEVPEEGLVAGKSLIYRFEVEDSGVGMSDDFADHVFDAFERERNSTASGTFGIGLGLSITKGLVEKMGGSITITTEKGQGTRVAMAIPFEVCANVYASENGNGQMLQEWSPEGLAGKRVLVVEDNELNRVITEAILKEAGMEVESVTDGAEAVSTIKHQGAKFFDLVLMDIQMPVMNGYDATRAIRALDDPDGKDLPILALSANSMEEDIRNSLLSGMNAHISKPIDVTNLLAAINKFLKEKHKPEN